VFAYILGYNDLIIYEVNDGQDADRSAAGSFAD
jgi:hypothetical protein